MTNIQTAHTINGKMRDSKEKDLRRIRNARRFVIE